MKVSIGAKIIDGPWGGGNLFVINLSSHLIEKGHEVVYDLIDDDIDLILLTDPRKSSESSTFTHKNIKRYKKKNSKVKVVHRINECDERKNTRLMNLRLRLSNYAADHTIFVGTWLTKLNVWRFQDKKPFSIILNGSDPEIFKKFNSVSWNKKKPIKIVTHHWSGNWFKGFDIYRHLDNLLDKEEWKDLIKFTYIGNLPKGFSFKNVNYVPPQETIALANLLKENHIYLTASINEPGGNHQNEGGMCGLPLLYRDSGCMKEYCEGFGISFNGLDDFNLSLKKLINEYDYWKLKMNYFDRNIHKCIKSYVDLIEDLNQKRDKIVKNRSLLRNPFVFFINQIIN